MGTIYYPDGKVEERPPANGRDYQLWELKTIVGGFIEVIGIPGGRLMVVNEDGQRLGLPKNDLATTLAALPTPREQFLAAARLKQQGLRVVIFGTLEEANQIVGTVLVCERNEVE